MVLAKYVQLVTVFPDKKCSTVSFNSVQFCRVLVNAFILDRYVQLHYLFEFLCAQHAGARLNLFCLLLSCLDNKLWAESICNQGWKLRFYKNTDSVMSV